MQNIIFHIKLYDKNSCHEHSDIEVFGDDIMDQIDVMLNETLSDKYIDIAEQTIYEYNQYMNTNVPSI